MQVVIEISEDEMFELSRGVRSMSDLDIVIKENLIEDPEAILGAEIRVVK
jgi:hypothetical protein